MTTSVYREFPGEREAEWDALAEADNPFHSARFCRLTQASGVENADYRYLFFEKNGRAIGTALLSAFTVDLNLFLDPAGKKWVGRLRSIAPDFLKVRILVCGLPVSLGQNNLSLPASPAEKKEVLEALGLAMNDIAEKEGIRYQVIKEFKTRELNNCKPLEDAGFFPACSIPYLSLPIRWTGFDDWLADLRHGYRRQVRASLNRSGHLKVELGSLADSSVSPEAFLEGYLSVMERTTVKLETLNLAFFRHLYAEYGQTWLALNLRDEAGVLRASALLAPQGRALIFLLVSKRAERDDTDTYFNLVYAMLRYAVEAGFETLHLGQTAYRVKQRIGGTAEEVFLFFKAKQGWKHRLLDRFRDVLFPRTHLEDMRVFKTGDK